jgi:hypothetical protein
MPDSIPAEPEWRDLAVNRPGEAARSKALELKRAAPVKTFIARAIGAKTQERAWRVGADGEEEVARRMRGLGEGWHVTHAVPVGTRDTDINHVAIGPPGVFTINTKNHSGNKVWVGEHAILVNGQKTDYLRTSRFEAERASKLLSAACGFSVAVQPVIVIMSAGMVIKAKPADVYVVGRKDIATWLSKRPPMITADVVAKIFEQGRQESTWRLVLHRLCDRATWAVRSQRVRCNLWGSSMGQ